MPASSLRDISMKDITVDKSGRVVISNPELAEVIKKAALPEFGEAAALEDTNIISCTSNGSNCGKTLE